MGCRFRQRTGPGLPVDGESSMTTERRYTILLDPDELDPDEEEGGYTVTVPALPGVVTQGATIEECQARAREAIALHIEGLLARGLLVPEERLQPQLTTVSVAA
jgi:predicted RNase H-like HicB family nuclease